MATVIDALVVTLGLDANKFRAGTKQAQGDLKSTSDESTKVAKEMEARGAQAAEFFGKIRNSAIGLFAVFTAGKGLQAFTRDSIESNAALGRMAANLGMTAEALNAWQGAAKRTGGSAEGVTSSFMGLGQEFQKLALTGTSSIVPLFRTLGINIADATGKARPMADVLLDLADKFKGMDPQKAIAFGSGIGLDPGTINLLMRGRQGVQELLAEQQKLGVVTGADADAAAKMQAALLNLEQASSKLGTTMLTLAAPGIVKVLEALTDLALWLQQHDDVTKGMFAGLAIAAAAFSIKAIAGVLGVIGAFAKLPVAMGEIAAATSLAWAPFIAAMATLAGVVDIFKRGPTGNIPDSEWENRQLGRKPGERAGTPVEELEPESWWNKVRRLVGSTTVPPPPEQIRAGKEAHAQLVGLGWTPEQAAGVVSNLQRESSFNPDSVGDGGQAYGLAQWHPDRQAAFKAWAGKDIRGSTQREQIAFLHHELTAGNEQSAGARLRNAKTAEEAGGIVSKYYERPADTEGESTKRAAGAADWLRRFQPVAPVDQGIANATRPWRGGAGMEMSSNTNSSSVTINGPITVTTNATDAQGVAAGLKGALMKYSFVPQANSGLA